MEDSPVTVSLDTSYKSYTYNSLFFETYTSNQKESHTKSVLTMIAFFFKFTHHLIHPIWYLSITIHDYG